MNEYTAIPNDVIADHQTAGMFDCVNANHDKADRRERRQNNRRHNMAIRLRKTGARCLGRGVALLLLSAVGAVAGWVAALGICISIGQYAIEWVRCNG